jgi:signal peptidase I
MITDDAATPGQAGMLTPDDRAIRSKATKRSWVCPGAGFALVGSGPLAVATFVASLCIVPAVAWLAFQPNAPSAWTTLVVFVIATVLWLAEQIGVKRLKLRAPRPSILAAGFVASGCIMCVAAILALGLLFTSFGSLRMAGSGMVPTLEIGERILYHKHVDQRRAKPGSIILFRNADDSAWGQPGGLVISRVLAGPGDQLTIKKARYLVNGERGPRVTDAGQFHAVIDVPSAPRTLTVPEGCYFVVQDGLKGGFDSRVLSWVHTDHIVGSRLWHFSDRGVFVPVE